tara:strand:- start:3165 stop:4256 length:1092 start_codon:yes stop_codon:yes gene_type:complete
MVMGSGKSFKKFFISIFVIIIFSLFIWYFSAHDLTDKKSNLNSNVPLKLVKVLDVTKSPYRKSISAQGSLLYSQSSSLTAQQDGVISGIYFKNGERVKKGKLLIKIDDSNLKQEALSKKAIYEQKYDVYHREYLLSKQSKGAYIASTELVKAKQDYLTALADYKSTEVSLSQASIKAPFDGIMGELNSDINIGSKVSLNTPLVSIYNKNKVEVKYLLNQKYYNKVKLGQPVNVYVKKNKKVIANVSFISPQVDESSSSFDVRALLDLKNNKYNLAGGMMVLIKQTFPKVKDIIMIPGIAIMTDSAGFHVFIVKKGKVQKVPVVIGESVGDNTVIKSGLKIGDKLVISGQQSLINGSLVKIIDS